jgi:hypothetical protein
MDPWMKGISSRSSCTVCLQTSGLDWPASSKWCVRCNNHDLSLLMPLSRSKEQKYIQLTLLQMSWMAAWLITQKGWRSHSGQYSFMISAYCHRVNAGANQWFNSSFSSMSEYCSLCQGINSSLPLKESIYMQQGLEQLCWCMHACKQCSYSCLV